MGSLVLGVRYRDGVAHAAPCSSSREVSPTCSDPAHRDSKYQNELRLWSQIKKGAVHRGAFGHLCDLSDSFPVRRGGTAHLTVWVTEMPVPSTGLPHVSLQKG